MASYRKASSNAGIASPDARSRRLRIVLVGLVATVVVAGCGGGGGGSGSPAPPPAQASLSLSPAQINVSAAPTDPAPTAVIQASITASASGSFYIDGTETTNGIQSVSGSAVGAVENVTVTFKSPASLAIGTYSDTITIRGCYDKACARQVSNSPQTVAVTYTISNSTSTSPPSITSLSPATAVAGGAAFTLTVNGSNFVPQSVVLWGGTAEPTTYLSANTLTAQIPAAAIAAAGSVPVVVQDQSGGPTSNGATFTIQPGAALALNSLSPAVVTAGGSPFMLTALGTGFTTSSAVSWNGSTLPTTYVSSTELTASVGASLIAATGSASIAVVNPAGQGGTSSTLILTIAAPSIDAVSYQIDAAHTGAITFKSVTFPSASNWSVNVGGTASYAIIVGGKVFVTVSTTTGGQLLALDAKTGAPLWGPIAFAGTANATYDGSALFVVSGADTTSQIVTAVDPATGSSKWSATVPGSWFPQPPVAGGGIVYTNNGGLVAAFDELTGAMLWQSYVGGTEGTVAVSVDGVYASSPCTTNDLRPFDGSLIWTANTGCSGGGGATPVVANGVLFSPIAVGGFAYSGNVYNAESGTLLGNFSQSVPPALDATTEYALTSGTLQGIQRSNNQILWSFAGDGALDTSPIAVNNYVIVGSSNGKLYALDGATGTQVWTQSLGAAIAPPPGGSYTIFTGLAAGDGVLVVPSGNNLTGYVLSTNP